MERNQVNEVGSKLPVGKYVFSLVPDENAFRFIHGVYKEKYDGGIITLLKGETLIGGYSSVGIFLKCPCVSGVHCKVKPCYDAEKGAYLSLEDLSEEERGVFVNGERVDNYDLRNGDKFSILNPPDVLGFDVRISNINDDSSNILRRIDADEKKEARMYEKEKQKKSDAKVKGSWRGKYDKRKSVSEVKKPKSKSLLGRLFGFK